MIGIFGITLPIFAAIGLGYGAAWFRAFSAADLRVLGRYVMNFALPGLMFSSVARSPLSEVLDPTYVLALGLAGISTAALVYLWFTLRPSGPARRALAVMGSICPNSGYIGYPMLLLALPSVAPIVLAMNILVENVVMVPLSFALLDASRPHEGQSLGRRLLRILRTVLLRPMVLGFVAGVLWSASGIPLPEPVYRLMSMLAASASALALFVIGGSLFGLPMKGNVGMALQVVAGKLLLHPILAVASIWVVTALGMPAISDDLHAALILSCAVPMLGIYAIVAQDYGHEGIASISLLMTTAAAFFTLSGLLWLLL